MRSSLYTYFFIVIALLYLGAATAQARPALTASADNASNVRLIGHLGGATYAVDVVSNRLYLGEGPSLTILDVANPAQPLFLGKTKPLPDTIRKVMVVNDRAYVAAGTAGLRVINVADPAAPIEVGFYDLPGQDFAKAVFVVGNIAYVAYDSDGLRIVNVANPAAPTEVGNYTLAGGNAEGVYVVGATAYVAYGAKGLRLVNVANPAAPVELGSYPVTNAYGVDVVNNRAYVAGGGLQIINVTNPTAPTELGTYNGVGGARDVQVVGSTAYLANSSNGMSIVNVADPTAPSELHIHQTPDYAGDLAVADNIAYVTNSDAGLRVINVTNPTAPNEISFYDPLEAAQSVYVNGSMAYVADGGSGLRIVNVANPNAPREVAVYDTPFYAFDVHVAGNIAYVADGYSLRLINVANPSAPSATGAYTPTGFADIRDVYVVDNIAYVANEANGLLIVNVADPAAPTELGGYDTPGYVTDLYAIGTTVYVADANKGLLVLNAANPAAPSKIASDESLTAATGVYAVGGRIYVADGNTGLRLFALTVASTLTPLGFYTLSAGDLSVVGNHVYVTDGAGLRVVDVTNTATPSEVGSYSITGDALDVAVAGGIAYLAGRDAGLFLLKYPPCYLLRVSQRGAGALPIPNLTNSPGCNSGEYLPGASITLSANPAPNWQVAGWIGTKNDSSTSKNNIVEMPAIEHEASVIYTPVCYILTLTHSGAGNAPTATPPNSPGCAPGQYTVGTAITLNASPAASYAVSGWSGTNSDNSTTAQNMLTMPGNNHTVNVIYNQVCFTLNRTHTGSGSDPTAIPAQSNDCPAQTYRSGVSITVTAMPGTGYTIGGWSGTINDSSTALTNTLTMPATDHTVRVDYLLACYPLTLTHSGAGSDPTATPAQSAGCPAGRYHANTIITLSGATPEAGWQIGSWSGATNNGSSANSNTVIMPANNHTAAVNYSETPTTGPGDSYETDGVCTRSRVIAIDGSEVQEHTFHAVADADWVRFTATSGQIYRMEVQVPVTSTADVNLEVYAQCEAAAFDSWNASFSPGARLDITAPASGPIYVRLANQDANLAGNNVRYTITVRALGNDAGNRALILVAGRLKGTDSLQKNIHNVTNAVYKLFQANGYNDSNIHYLATDATLPGYDAAANQENLRTAITQWAKAKVGSDGVLNLYLMDHGSPDIFYLDDVNGQRLTPDDLHNWLNELESALPNVKINVFIEACQSGSFITRPGSISKAGRVVITSSNAENDAKASKDGAYFSDHLLTWLRQGYNLSAAFGEASSVARTLFSLQRAMLDADGNGLPNEFSDSNTAAKRSFAYAGSLGDEWPPHIFAANPVTGIRDQKVRLRVDVRDNQSVRQVWAVVYDPDYTPPSVSQLLQPEVLPTFLFTRVDNDNHWEAEISGLSKTGNYQIMIHADDEQGWVARPVSLTVTTNVTGQTEEVYLPLVRK